MWSCVYLRELNNRLAAGGVFPPATCCLWLHGLWPWKQTMENRHMKKTIRFRFQISCAYCPLLYFIALQTWKTSRRREEALFQSERAKEWFCCVARRHILEVKQHRDHYIKDYDVFSVFWLQPLLWFSLSQLHYATSAHTMNSFSESSIFSFCIRNIHGLN